MTLVLDGHDRITVDWDDTEDDDEQRWLAVKLTSEITVLGPVAVMQAWANEIQLAVTTA